MKVRLSEEHDGDGGLDVEMWQSLVFDELPGKPIISFTRQGFLQIRFTRGAMNVVPEATNSITIGVQR